MWMAGVGYAVGGRESSGRNNRTRIIVIVLSKNARETEMRTHAIKYLELHDRRGDIIICVPAENKPPNKRSVVGE